MGKEYVKAVYCHPAYLAHMQNTSCGMRGWMKHKLESTLLEEISMTSGSWHLPYGGKWRGTKEPLDEDERGEWKTWLKINIQKTKIMASYPIISWQIDGETMEAVTDFILGLQNQCKWWLQPWHSKMLAPWKKNYDQPRQHIKKQRHYFANKVLTSQSYGFSSSHVWMWVLDYKKGSMLNHWCFWAVVLKKTV